MKKLISVVLCICMLLSVCAYAEGGITVVIDGSKQSFDTDAQILNSRTVVPLRAIFEVLGAKVAWDDATRTVTANRGIVDVKLTIESDTAYVNGKEVKLDQSAVIIDGRTMVDRKSVV